MGMDYIKYKLELAKNLEEKLGTERYKKYNDWSQENNLENPHELTYIVGMTQGEEGENLDDLAQETFLNLRIEGYLFEAGYNHRKAKKLALKDSGLPWYQQLLFRFFKVE